MRYARIALHLLEKPGVGFSDPDQQPRDLGGYSCEPWNPKADEPRVLMFKALEDNRILQILKGDKSFLCSAFYGPQAGSLTHLSGNTLRHIPKQFSSGYELFVLTNMNPVSYI